MRKFFSLIAALLFAGSMMAQVTITPADFTPVETSDYSTTIGGVTVAVTASTVTAEQMRIFKNQTITISAESNITGIEFTCTANGTAKYGPGCFAAQDGYTFDAAGPTGTWTGSATSVTFTASTNQVRATQIVVTLEGGEPVVVDTYTVAGNDAAIFGTSWDVTNTANDMVKAAGIYKWEKAELNLTAGTIIAFKVAKNHSWDVAYPAQNDTVTIAEEGEYTLTITFDPATGAVAAEAVKKVALADPTNCAEAAAAALTVSANNVLYNDGAVYTINGFVTAIQTAYSDQYHNITFWMADAADGGNVLEAYRAACASEADAPVVGDKVAVTGKLTKYGTTPEFAAGCTFVITEHATPIVPTVNYYVAGSMNGWAANEAYMLTPNNESLYQGEFTFAANDEFKVIGFDGTNTTWYPEGMGNNFQITEAGDYKITFNPAGNVDGWYSGYYNVVKKAEAQVITVSQAMELGMALDSMGVSEADYIVEGYVINPGAFSMLYKNQSWYMADEATAAASDFQAYNCYPIQGNDTLKVLAGDKVQVLGKLKKYYNKNASKYIIEIEKGNASFISMVDGDHTVVSTTETATVAQALTIGAALADNASTEKQYTITGYVSAINVKSSDAYSDQYKNQSFWVADDATSTASTNADGAFYVYRGKPETEAEIPVGTKVQFTCTIKKYVPSAGGDPVIENADQNIIIKILGDAPVDDADVVFTSAEFNGLGTSGTGSEVNVVKDGVTFNCDKAFGDQYGVRCYKNSNVTITSAEQQIGKIVFEFATVSGTYYNGGLDDEIVVNAMSWNAQSLSMQARMNKVKIYFGEYEKPEPVAMDTINAAEAKARAEALAENTESDKLVVLAYVASVKTEYSEQYGNITVWLNDDPSSTYGDIQAYRAKVSAEYGPKVQAGDRVMLVGKLAHSTYDSNGETKHSYQIAAGAEMSLLWAQGIENVVMTEKVQKVMVDGVLYIVRDNKMFNVQGVQVR